MITDYRMPGMTGVELCRRGQEVAPEALRIILTAYTDVDSLMEAINTGHIWHFVPKPWDPADLLVVVRRAAERWRLERENARLRDELELAYNALRREAAEARERPISFDRLVGQQTGLRRAVELARKVLDGDTTVLLLGETGTGKELFARLLHDNGPRRAARFVAQNCGALPESPAGIGALRPRPRGLHRGHGRAARPLRRGRRQHGLPRRGRGDESRDAAPPAARPAGGGGAPSRCSGSAQGERSGHRRHQRRPRGRRRCGALPARPLLPAQRVPDPAAPVARAYRGHPGPCRDLPPAGLSPGPEGGPVDLAGGHGAAPGLPVSRQCPRARERDRAGGGPGRGWPADRTRASLRSHRGPRGARRGPERSPRRSSSSSNE